jgi:cellulose biosynthesis protein BcsQ
MKSIAIFNNKGGVGKTTLTYHVAFALAELGHRTLIIDLDPQSNITLYGLTEEELTNIWTAEDAFIEDFQTTVQKTTPADVTVIAGGHRSIHFLLKATEDGTGEIDTLATPVELHPNLGLIPGRLTVHMFEERIASRWSDAYRGEPLAVRTVTKIRKLCTEYASARGYEFVIVDTSPSLGILNKVIISTMDGFLIPCMPDLFSLYGIRNIGRALALWKRDFQTMWSLLSDAKRSEFPLRFVQFLGFTIYKAKKYSSMGNPWDLATAHYGFAERIPQTIQNFIPADTYQHLPPALLPKPVGETAVMHDHMTMAAMAQKYKRPIWLVPAHTNLEPEDRNTIMGNRGKYEATQNGYHAFATDFLVRLQTLS